MGLSMLLGLCIWGLESRAREGLREAEHIQALIAAVCSRAVFVGGHPDRYVRIADHGNFNPLSVKPLSVRGSRSIQDPISNSCRIFVLESSGSKARNPWLLKLHNASNC